MIPGSFRSLARLLLVVGHVMLLDAATGRSPYAQTPDAVIASDFAALRTSAAAGRGALNGLDEALGALAAQLRTRPETAVAAEPLARLGDARAALARQDDVLGRAAAYLSLVTAWQDGAHEVERLAADLRADLPAVATAAIAGVAAAGEKTAGAEAAASAYRKALGDVTALATAMSARARAAREAAALGSDAQGGKADERWRDFVAQFGEAAATATPLVPSSPPDLFRPLVRPADPAADVAYLWDPVDGEWTKLPGAVPIEEVFRDVWLASGRRPRAGQLKYLATNYRQVDARRATSDGLSVKLRDALTGGRSVALSELGKEYARLATAEPWLFRAEYIYDPDFRSRTHTVIDQVRVALMKSGEAGREHLAELDAMLDRFGIALDSHWASAAVPPSAVVKVTAWFADAPKTRFVSTWRFDKERVKVEIEQGYASGTRKGDTTRTEGSIPGRNCTALDTRTFDPGGKLTFRATYTCKREDGSEEVSEKAGEGTWALVTEPAKPAAKGAR